MALTVQPNLLILTQAESFVGWANIGSGSSGAEEPDFFVQGDFCVSKQVSGRNARKGMYYTPGVSYGFAPGNAYQHQLVYIWVTTSTPGLLTDIADNGMEILLGADVNNYRSWHVSGGDFNDPTEAWRCYVIDPQSPGTRDVGTYSPSNVGMFGAVIETSANAKGYNIGIDQIAVGTGLTVTGTNTVEGEGFREIADIAFDDARLNRWGIVTEKSGIYFIKGKINIGNGSTATNFTSQNETVVWQTDRYLTASEFGGSPLGANHTFDLAVPLGTSDVRFGLNVAGGPTTMLLGAEAGDGGRSGTSLSISGFTDGSGSGVKRVDAGITVDPGATVGIYGSAINNFSQPVNLGSAEAKGTTFNGNGVVFGSSSAVWRNNNFLAAPGIAFEMDSTTDIASCSFIGNNVAVSVLGALDATFNDLSFDSNTTDVQVASPITIFLVNSNASTQTGGATTFNDLSFDSNTTDVQVASPITIFLVNSNASTQTGGATFVNSIQLTLTGLEPNSEVRVFDGGTLNEIAGQENVTTGTFTTGIDAATYTSIDISVISLGYLNFRILGLATTSAISIPIQQTLDRQYSG
jgi:hypothetical protein